MFDTFKKYVGEHYNKFMNAMIGFYTKFTTTEEHREALIDILSRASKSMEEIEDCRLYVLNKDQSDPTLIWVTEIWASKEAHMQALLLESSKELIQKAMHLMSANPEQIKLDIVCGKGIK